MLNWYINICPKRGDIRVDDVVWHSSVPHLDADVTVKVSQFGIPRTPEDFCRRDVKCGHPRGMSMHLPEVVTDVLRENLEMEPAELALIRCRQLARWTVRAGQLKLAEKEFKQSLPEHLQVLLKDKKLLLLQEMLEELQYPDKTLVQDIASGFRLMGWQQKTGVFPQCVKRPQFSVETLRKLSRGLTGR